MVSISVHFTLLLLNSIVFNLVSTNNVHLSLQTNLEFSYCFIPLLLLLEPPVDHRRQYIHQKHL
jgi:hypothetical protein